MLILILLFGLSLPTFAGNVVTHYYFGEGRRTFMGPVPDSKVPLLVRKDVDVDLGEITEFATTFNDQTRKFFDATIKAKVVGTGMVISDDSGMLTGIGKVSGLPGHWDFLYFEMLFKDSGMRVEDENYIDNAKKRLIARKRIYRPDGALMMLWDGELPEITPEQYEAKYKELHGKN